MNILLMIHSILRWVILLVAVIAIIKFLAGWLRYYSYIWAEVLDADAFQAFKEKGIFDPATARSFRTNILEKGYSEEPMTLYKRFRGRAPEVAPLLERRGLKLTTEATE